ncbi:hypothetical protein ABVK25_001854 [Lepraria finkii]|uniref:ATPase AAA-type core domain-containing protein n=1 Tax=Lepraria finkii TaxID=1340010 RepID=A0ABR4BMH2_9LECA
MSVLLLDEADIFLAKREKGGDLERNGIVSVFLRVLEYYSGILILTTNRIGQFDEAFSSRVHIKLYYPKLDEKSTINIWKMNLKRIPRTQLDLDVEDDKIIKFAKQQWAETKEKQTQRWNGRQIKNAFQTAIALARWDHQEAFRDDDNQRACLSVKQFKIVAETSAHFDDYISIMYGVDEGDTWDVIAARDCLRKNEYRRKVAKRSGTLARSPRWLRRNDDNDDDYDEDEDEDEDDENEEKMKKKM